MARRRKVSNLLALAILAQLSFGEAMHPYEIATVLKQTNKEHDMKIKWGSLYTVVQNLEKHGFIEATGTDREGRRPERTSYVITEPGRAELTDWLSELVAVPEVEQTSFVAALSVVGVLPPDKVIALLERRLSTLDAAIASERSAVQQAAKEIPRVFLVEAEFELAMREAEASWVRGILTEIEQGTLSGVAEWREYHRTGQMPAQFTQMLEEAGQKMDS